MTKKQRKANRQLGNKMFNDIHFMKEPLIELLKEQYCKENNLPYVKPPKIEREFNPIDQRLYFS